MVTDPSCPSLPRTRTLLVLTLVGLVVVSGGLPAPFDLSLGAKAEGAVISLLLVEDKVYQPEDAVTVNFYLQKEGDGVSPEKTPVLQINPDAYADDSRGTESRNVSMNKLSQGHYSTTFLLKDSDFGELGNVHLRIIVKVDGESVRDDEDLEVDLGALPDIITLRLSRIEALPGETLTATLTAMDRTRNYRLLDLEELTLTYRLPGDSNQQSLNFQQSQGLARADLTVPAQLTQGGALTFTAEGRLAGQSELFTRHATVWVPLLRVWIHPTLLDSDRLSFELWVAEAGGQPLEGAQLELDYRFLKKSQEQQTGHLSGTSSSQEGYTFDLPRPAGSTKLELTGSVQYNGLSREFVYDWNLIYSQAPPLTLRSSIGEFSNFSFFPNSPLKLSLKVDRQGVPLANSRITLLAASATKLLVSDSLRTDSEGRFILDLTLPAQPGRVDVAVEDQDQGDWAFWFFELKDLRLNLMVERLQLAKTTNMTLALPPELALHHQLSATPRLELTFEDPRGASLGWFPVADPAGEASPPAAYRLDTYSQLNQTGSLTALNLTLPAFLPSGGGVRFRVEAYDSQTGRTTANFLVLRPGQSTADLPGPPPPVQTEPSPIPWAAYLGSLTATLLLAGLLVVYAARRRGAAPEEADEEEEWELPLQPPTPAPPEPTAPYYGAPAAAPPPLTLVACPHCAGSMGVTLQPGTQVLVACPHCGGQSRVG